MGSSSKSLLMLKTQLVSVINIHFVNVFSYGNMLWAFDSLRVFVCNYVLYLLGLIFRYISRFLHVGDGKNDLTVQPPQADSVVNGLSEEFANFLFNSSEDVHEGHEEREGETESSAFMENASDLHEDREKIKGEIDNTISDVPPEDRQEEEEEEKTESSVLMVFHSDIHEVSSKEIKVHPERTVLKERGMEEDESAKTLIHGKEDEGEAQCFVFIESDSEVHEDGKELDEDEPEISISMENDSIAYKDSNKNLKENEKEISSFMENESNFGDEIESKKSGEEGGEETEGPVLTTTSKCEYMSGKSIISGFLEEPTAMRFSFREFYMDPYVSSSLPHNSCAADTTTIIADTEFSEPELHEKEDSVLDHVSISSNDIPFHFDSGAFGGTESSDEDDDVIFNENSVVSDSESESSSSSGLIWGSLNKIDDSFGCQDMAGMNYGEVLQTEILKLITKDERTEAYVEKKKQHSSYDGKVSGLSVQCNYGEDGYIESESGMKNFESLNHGHGFSGVNSAKVGDFDKKDTREETRWEEELGASEFDEGDFEWEHDDLVEQLRMELKHARQGGLATIIEEEEEVEVDPEDEDEREEHENEAKSPEVVEDLKPLNIEEKVEYRDLIDEIEKVYKGYAEKMRKLDILNYQTMHALGLIQLRDPLKLTSTPKSTIIPGAKPAISQNLWPRKASSKSTYDPLLKLVHELHRDLELVYVGQVCLSWEILCWQQKKALELQQFDSQEPRRYNHVAGEFQLFQVLMQRFIENEPFQGPRIQNYVKNRCVIRNLLQVPAIKDDSMKDKNTTSKGHGEEDSIPSGRLADIIMESMRVFWEFVRADKDNGNVILKVSQQIGCTDLKDPAISGLLVDIKTQLPKKEKRLRDIVRSGNCIVKKFQKHHEDQLDHEQLVAQVGLRLISRVLNLSKLRKEQIIWCNEKLHRIRFLSRKIVQVEPSFLLFPC